MAQDERVRGLGMRGEKAGQIRGIVLAVSVQGGDRGGAVAERGAEPRPERGALALAARVPENLHGAGPRRDPGAPVRGGVVHHDHGAVRAQPLDDAAQRANLVEHRDDGPEPVGHAAAFRSWPKGRSTSATWVPPRARPWTSAGAGAPSGRLSGRTTNRRSWRIGSERS